MTFPLRDKEASSAVAVDFGSEATDRFDGGFSFESIGELGNARANRMSCPICA